MNKINNEEEDENQMNCNRFSISKYNFDESLELFFIKLTGGVDENGKPKLFTPIIPKVIYFLLFYLFGTSRPYTPLHLKHLGIDPKAMGFILLFPPLISFIFSPIWSGIADSKNAHKLVFLIMTFGSGTCCFLLNFIKNQYFATFIILLNAVYWSPIIPLADSTCYKILGVQNKDLYGKQRMLGSFGFCVSAFFTGYFIQKFGTINVAWINYPIFATILFLFTLFFFNSKPINSLFEKINYSKIDTLNLLNNNSNNNSSISNNSNNSNSSISVDDEELNGNQSLLNHAIINNDDNDDGADQIPKTTTTTTTTTNDQMIEDDNNEENEDKLNENILPIVDEIVTVTVPPIKKYTFIQGVGILLSNPRIAIILFNCIIVATGMSVCNNFLALTITDERYFNAPTSLVGISSILNVTFEIVFFFFGKQLLSKIGIFKLIIISHCALIIRVVSYSFLLRLKMSGWSIVPVELLHGIVFASIWNSGSSIINANSPAGLEATGQSLLFGIYMGVGTSIGALVGGVLYESNGPITMFEFVAAIVSFGLLVFLIAEFLLFNKNGNERKRQLKIEMHELEKQKYNKELEKHQKEQQQQAAADNGIPIYKDEDKEEEELNLKFNQLLKDELIQKEIDEAEEAQYNNLILNSINDEIENNNSALL